MKVAKRAIRASAVVLARLGIIDEGRGIRIADLAWPRVVTGLARESQRTADFVMVGIAIGPAAIAGLGFAFAYWMVAIAVAYSLANGAMAFLSQRYGADDMPGMDLAFKQTLWIELLLAGLFITLYTLASTELVAVLGAGPEALVHGSVYLQVVVWALVFDAISLLAGRALVSANDAWTPMVIRAGGAVANIGLNAIFIFGLGLGVFGAALGTVLSSAAITVVLVVGFLRGRLPHFGELPVKISVTGPWFDLGLTRQIIEVGTPLVARELVSRVAQFPMLAIVAQFGTVIVAAYVASREVRALMNTPGWGFGTAARSLVGQQLGANDEGQADEYGWDVLRFSTAVYALMAVLMIVFAPQIAAVFVDEPGAIEATVPFLIVMAISLLGLGIDTVSEGVLTGGGDTRWPLYARLVGLYVFMLPLAYAGVITPLGVLALYLAITAETVVPALITFYRFNSGVWIDISRRYRQPASD